MTFGIYGLTGDEAPSTEAQNNTGPLEIFLNTRYKTNR
jgi:hypothetical protein